MADPLRVEEVTCEMFCGAFFRVHLHDYSIDEFCALLSQISSEVKSWGPGDAIVSVSDMTRDRGIFLQLKRPIPK